MSNALLNTSKDGDLMIESNNVRISLDRRERESDIDFISHAHTDHLGAARSSKGILASQQTIELIESAYGLAVRNRASCTENMRLLEAGHMLGSRQLSISCEERGARITYTGDFKTSRSRTVRPIEVVDSDMLIMDSTYADSLLRFEDNEEVESALQDWTLGKIKNGIVVFSAYAMGKAQELIAILNEVEIKPLVSRKISRVSRVYNDNGARLDYSSAYDSDESYDSLVHENFVGITDSRGLPSFRAALHAAHNKRVYTAVATGFAKIFRFDTDAQFALSDHADFSQSVDYIEASHSSKVLTYGPNARQFAANLSREGYDAEPFSDSAAAAMMAVQRA